jgi:hypothetical protein
VTPPERRAPTWCLSAAAFILGLTLATTHAQVSDLKLDQEIIFFPTIGYRSANRKGWDMEIHGCVYEAEKRRAALFLLRHALDLKSLQLTEAQNATFTARARLFMVDHERGRRIVVRIANKVFKLPKSEPNGHFSDVVHLSNEEVEGIQHGLLSFTAELDKKDPRVFSGAVSLVGQNGLSVISDIDDTIKITGVHDRKTTLRATFLESFKPVPGMAELYRSWAQTGDVHFCYLSASPWQLFTPMAEFVLSKGFPPGAFYLKDFRWKDRSVFNLFQDPEKYKPGLIDPLLKRFINRRFVLVGDSGERDPEIYGAVARRYPSRILRILIRDVTEASSDPERYESAFRDLPKEMWTVFREPAEIRDRLKESR